MGIVNVTPDSFVGEVRTPGVDAALSRSQALLDAGADIIDVGGESTRPGAAAVGVEEEIARVRPVIEGVAAMLTPGTTISIDTRHEEVAIAGIEAGASIINDMSCRLGPVAGRLGVGYVAGHMQGVPQTMQTNPHYDDVVAEVLEVVVAAADEARAAGATSIWVDPGVGFGKTIDHNLELIAHMDRFVASEFPVLLGVSRKRSIGLLHAASDAGVLRETPPDLVTLEQTVGTDDRLEGGLAMALWAADLGVDMIRTHDIAETVQALRVVAAKKLV